MLGEFAYIRSSLRILSDSERFAGLLTRSILRNMNMTKTANAPMGRLQ